MRADIAGQFRGQGVPVLQLHPSQPSHRQGGGEGVTRSHGVQDLHPFGPAFRPVARLVKEAALAAPGQRDELQIKARRQLFKLPFFGAG